MRSNYVPMGACATARVKADTPEGFVIINESDFDPAKHERHAGVAPLPPPPSLVVLPPPPVAANPLANLPRDWRERKTGWLRALAEQVNDGRTPETREQAIQVIESKLPAR